MVRTVVTQGERYRYHPWGHKTISTELSSWRHRQNLFGVFGVLGRARAAINIPIDRVLQGINFRIFFCEWMGSSPLGDGISTPSN